VRCPARGGEPRQLVLSDPREPSLDGIPLNDPADGEVRGPFDDEEPPDEVGPPELDAGHQSGRFAGLVMAGALVLAYLATGPREADGTAFQAGSADAGRILSGELWRTVTALTLHADVSHLVANVTAGAFLGTAVCRTLGGGLGALLIVATGIAGNGLNAFLHGPLHVSVGASTAVLGAVGLLSGLAFARTRRTRRARARSWLPLAAGLALLGMLGSDPHTDLGAHLCGFVVGVVLGAIAGWTLSAVPGRGIQRALAATALAVVAASWWCALRA